ncbi:hypothetical protein [uncultured Gemmiger sp.]|nr:hypothetical protein [uncultured Gemmiger sp.]
MKKLSLFPKKCEKSVDKWAYGGYNIKALRAAHKARNKAHWGFA